MPLMAISDRQANNAEMFTHPECSNTANRIGLRL